MKIIPLIFDFISPRFCVSCNATLFTDEYFICEKCYSKISILQTHEIKSEFDRKGKINVHMLLPTATERTVRVCSNQGTHNVFGESFTPPRPARPEANGHRVMFSPMQAETNDIFLTVMSMSDVKVSELPIDLQELPEIYVISVADRVVILSKSGALIKKSFKFNITTDSKSKLLLTALASGNWSVRSNDEKIDLTVTVKAGSNTAFVILPAGEFTVSPLEIIIPE